MSVWNHLVCQSCWKVLRGDRVPVTIVDDAKPCCGCGDLTTSGIYVRQDPKTIACEGRGKVHQET